MLVCDRPAEHGAAAARRVSGALVWWADARVGGGRAQVGCREEFVERARHFVFETYCRIHQCIDVRMLAEKLNMEQVEAERWVVNLIRNERLNAKIDAAAGTVVMGAPAASVYEQLLERSKSLSHRGMQLASQITSPAAA